jgi:hypothetical protein
MRVEINGFNLPGRSFCRPDGSVMDNVHVGIQVRGDPALLVRADEAAVRWSIELDVVHHDGLVDFRGPVVHGKRGERFVYLTWCNVIANHHEMFRRAKLMLNRIDPSVVESADATGVLVGTIDLTDDRGGPRCARVDPPALAWSVGTAEDASQQDPVG